MHKIRAFIGLGNPGDEYENTRHNAGFWFVDALASKFQIDWSLHQKSNGLYASVISDGVSKSFFGDCPKGEKIFLFKPMKYMNLSGICLANFAKFFNLKPEQICVIHDELDLPVGQIRLKFSGGLGGHNGLKDIKANLKTSDFYRLRIGISHPGQSHLVTNYVLKKPSIADKNLILDSIDRGIDEVADLLSGNISHATKRLNSVK